MASTLIGEPATSEQPPGPPSQSNVSMARVSQVSRSLRSQQEPLPITSDLICDHAARSAGVSEPGREPAGSARPYSTGPDASVGVVPGSAAAQPGSACPDW